MPAPASWSCDAPVTSVVDTAEGTPGSYVALVDDPMAIVMAPATRAQSIEVTMTMADGVPVPVQVGSVVHVRVVVAQ